MGRLCYSVTTRWCLSQPFTQQTHNSDIQPAIHNGSIVLFLDRTSLVIERVGGSLERIGSFLLKRISCRSCGCCRLGLNLIIEIDSLVAGRILALLPHHLHLVLDSLVTFLIAPVVNLLVGEPGSFGGVTLQFKLILEEDRKYL